jgi:Domain of unknown function (DUF4124)
MARPFAVLLALLATALLAMPAQAQWKWKDKGGHVQYSDLPPPSGTPEQDILGRPNGPRRGIVQTSPASSPASGAAVVAAASAPTSRPVDAELEAKRKKAEADAAAKNKAEQDKVIAAKAENCSRAKAQLTTLDSGIRIVRANGTTGEREFLDDKQRADEAKRTRDVIANDCK